VTLVRANYDAAVEGARDLDEAVAALVAMPSARALESAKRAWLAAREPYGQTEAYRFYDGPIDDPETGLEGEINGWPLDESFIDATVDAPDSGMINRPEQFPELTADLLRRQNERGGEDNIATGYHAVEFLLWGQDRSVDGPGDRPYTDFLAGEGATLPHGDRRGQYLKAVSGLLLADLEQVRAAWDDDAYARSFAAQPADTALRSILRGMTRLSGFELSGERMTTAWENEDQEDEHSCFSDNTHRDIYLNALAVENVYRGRYADLDGPGLDELVAARDPALADELEARFEAVFSAIEKLPVPFDQGLTDASKKPQIKAAIDALVDLTDSLLAISTALGLEPWQ
jgi:putative iron-regulated protein